MADSNERKTERRSHRRRSRGGDENADAEKKKDRLLRAARRFVQDHGREEKDRDGAKNDSGGKSRRHHRRSKRGPRDSGEDRRRDDGKSARKSSAVRDERKRRRGEKRPRESKVSAGAPLHPMGPLVSSPPEKKIDEEKDYFSFHSQLRLYLYRSSGTFFEDLKASETRTAFAEFCKKYNGGKLEEAYYNDVAKLPKEALQQCKRTRHAWNFKTNSTEQQSLGIIRAGVEKQTEYNVKVTKPGATSQNYASGGRKATIAPRPDNAVTKQAATSHNYGLGGRKATIAPRLNNPTKRDTEPKQEDEMQGKESLLKKEDEQRAMLKMLGLSKIKTGQKITIAPRK